MKLILTQFFCCTLGFCFTGFYLPLSKQSTDGSVIMTSTLTFMASADHHNQSILCSASYPLANGGSSPSAATSRRLSILCERLSDSDSALCWPTSAGRFTH